MTPAQYVTTLSRLGLSQAQAAELLGYSRRESTRYASGTAPIPRAVALVLLLMLEYWIPVDTLRRLK